jgi:hypothetical protein
MRQTAPGLNEVIGNGRPDGLRSQQLVRKGPMPGHWAAASGG